MNRWSAGAAVVLLVLVVVFVLFTRTEQEARQDIRISRNEHERQKQHEWEEREKAFNDKLKAPPPPPSPPPPPPPPLQMPIDEPPEDQLLPEEQRIINRDLRDKAFRDQYPDHRNDLTIVIVRAGESLNWIERLGQHNIVIINRGGPVEIGNHTNRITVIKSETGNGRECSGYLSYIIDHYHNVSGITAFLHGHPFNHNKHMLHWLNKLAWEGNLHENHVERDDDVVDDPVGFIPLNDFYVFRCGPMVDWCCALGGLEGYWHGFWNKPGPAPECVGVWCCAQFAVSKKRIQANTIQVYQNTLNPMLGGGAHHECYVMEHSWHLLFDQLPILNGIPEPIWHVHKYSIETMVKSQTRQTCDIQKWINDWPKDKPMQTVVTDSAVGKGPWYPCPAVNKAKP